LCVRRLKGPFSDTDAEALMAKSKLPAGLGIHGRRLWRDVVVNDDLELDARERFWLYSAAKLADRAAELEDALARDGRLLVKGSMGQEVGHPLLTELRQVYLAVSQTLGRLKVEEPESGVLGVVGANKARGAANARWRPGGGA
jgi:hypothetical protein